MAKVSGLVPMLEGVYLGGIIDECVLSIKDNIAKIRAMDMTSAVYVQASCPFEHVESKIGLGNLSLFVKYLKSYASDDMAFTQVDNVMTIKPEKGGTLKYLLSETDLVPTYNAAWDEDDSDPIAEMIAAADCTLIVTEDEIKEFLKLMSLFKPNSAIINVSKRGIVTLHGGNETQNQFDVVLGKREGQGEPIAIKLYGANINAVLSAIDFADPVTMYLVNGEVVIVSSVAAWVLRPLSTENSEE